MSFITQKIKKIFYLVIEVFLACLVIAFCLDFFYGKPVGKGEKKITLNVKKGDTASTIGTNLQKQGIIVSKNYLSLLFKVTRKSHLIKQGFYELNDSMKTREVYKLLLDGKVKLIKITIPEGFHNRQIADLLIQKKIIKNKEEFVSAAKNPSILNKYKIPAKTLEGYLYPETYTVPSNYPIDKFLDLMTHSFFKKLKEIPQAKEYLNQPDKLHKKVILASILEREAKKEFEKPIMASVFLNRLEKNINLESCATIQYIFEKPKKRLLNKDLKIKSPYNTYLNSGFPPGPISSPGFSSIQAAFSPDKTDYLYFLVKPNNTHYFSKSFSEHLVAKKKFIDPLY